MKRVGVAKHHSVKAANHSNGKNGNCNLQEANKSHLDCKPSVVKKEDVGFF